MTEPTERSGTGPVARGCLGVLGAMTLGVFALAVTRCDSTLALVDNVVAVFEEPEWAGGLDTADGVLDYLVAHRSDVGLVVATVGDSGALQFAAPHTIAHNADEPMPLASTVKLIHLAAWARASEDGRLDPAGALPAARWSSWYLPNTDGGAHAKALEDLGVADPPPADAAVPWSSVARAMVRHSDNAAPDLIRDELGDSSLNDVIQQGGLRTHDPVGSLLGRMLLGANHDQPDGDTEALHRLLGQPVDARLQAAQAALGRWLDPPWQQAERTWRTEDAPLGRLRRQALLARLFPRAGAGDYARMLAAISSESFLSPAISRRMKEHLQWPMAVGDNAKRFASFGSKGGALPGVIADATYVTPRLGDFAGRTRVVVLLVRNMPMSGWLRLLETHGQQYFVLKVAQRQAFADKVAQRLTQSPPPE